METNIFLIFKREVDRDGGTWEVGNEEGGSRVEFKEMDKGLFTLPPPENPHHYLYLHANNLFIIIIIIIIIIINIGTLSGINSTNSCNHLFLCLIHLKTIRNKVLLNIRNIIQNRALIKGVLVVTNSIVHTISEFCDVLFYCSKTGNIHVHTKDLMIFETISNYKGCKRIMYINFIFIPMLHFLLLLGQ